MLSLKPAVRDHLDEVLWWKWVKEWHCEGKMVFNSNLGFFQDELFAMQDLFGVSVFHEDPERLCPAMISPIPLELLVRLKLEFDTHRATCDWLDKGTDLEARKFVNEAKYDLAHLWIFY